MKKLLYKGSAPYKSLSEEEKELIVEVKSIIKENIKRLKVYKHVLKLDEEDIALLGSNRSLYQSKKDYTSNVLSDLVHWAKALMNREIYLQRKAYPYHNLNLRSRIKQVHRKEINPKNSKAQSLETKAKQLEEQIVKLKDEIKRLNNE